MVSRVLFATVLCFLIGSASQAQQKAAFPLPADSSIAVLSVDSRGGFWTSRVNAPPVFALYGDGRVVYRHPTDTSRNLDAMLSPAQVQALLHFAIDDQEFFGLKREDIEQAIEADSRRDGFSLTVHDATTVHIRITLADRQNEVSFYALGAVAAEYPRVKPLQQLYAVERRVNALVAVLRDGGPRGIEDALQRANAHLLTEQPGLPALSADDYSLGMSAPDGRRLHVFVRSHGDGTVLSVRVEFSREGEALVRVTPRVVRSMRSAANPAK
jgi:hypothetical protein